MRRALGAWLLGGLLVLLVCLAGALYPHPARAQFGDEPAAVRTVDAVTNLYASFEPGSAVDGYEVDLPGDWVLENAVLLRYGSESIPVRIDDERPYLVRTDAPLRGPHDVILRVRTGSQPGTSRWSITPVARDSSGRLVVKSGLRKRQRLNLKRAGEPDAGNPALQFTPDATAPVMVSAPDLPKLHGRSPFTVEFWMQTTDLGAVVLSTWTGEESQPYPLEVVVDASGHLRAYTGRPQQHRALLSRTPVADGQWHHVAVVHDPQGGRLRLHLDGSPVDSLSGVQVASPLRPSRLAVGGRLGTNRRDPKPQFAGTVDEIRVWGGARSAADLRRTMHRPSTSLSAPRAGSEAGDPTLKSSAENGGGTPPPFLQLDASDAVDNGRSSARSTASLPEGVEQVASTLRFQRRLQDLEAATEGDGVVLRWQAPATGIRAFVIEQSTDGRTFTRTATLGPDDAKDVASGIARYTYTEPSPPSQVVYYRIRQVFDGGSERLSGTLKVGLGDAPEDESAVNLLGNFPNPFASSTTVTYEVTESTPVTITVWDVTGQRITRLVDGTRSPGYYEITFDAGSRPSGTYFLRLDTPTDTQSHRMVLLK